MKEASKELCLEGADAGLPVRCNVIALLWNAPGSHMQLRLSLYVLVSSITQFHYSSSHALQPSLYKPAFSPD